MQCLTLLKVLGLTAYFDGSGDADDPKCRFVGVGGLCAPEAEWRAFDKKWQAILDHQCSGVWFHMEQFASREGVFKGWNEARRQKLLGSLVKAILDTNARPFGAVVSLDAYEYLADALPGVEKFFGEPYHLCFQDVTRAAALQAMEHSWPFAEGVEQVAMVYAQQKHYGAITSKPGTSREQMGRAESLWYAIKDTNPHFGQWMGTYETSTPKVLNFLQAADLFAYELTHEFENRVNPKRASDKMRWALAHMLPAGSRNFLHKFYGLEQLVELLLDNKCIAVAKDQASAGSINSSLSKIAMRDLLFQRRQDRRKGD
jgi:hypothetical protein